MLKPISSEHGMDVTFLYLKRKEKKVTIQTIDPFSCCIISIHPYPLMERCAVPITVEAPWL